METDTMKIYRVQNQFAEGPFCTGHARQAKYRNRKKFPEVMSDTKIDTQSVPVGKWGSYLCGTASHQQLFHWFSKQHLKKMHTCGFVVVEVEVPREHVLIGSCQVFFDKNKFLYQKEVTMEILAEG